MQRKSTPVPFSLCEADCQFLRFATCWESELTPFVFCTNACNSIKHS